MSDNRAEPPHGPVTIVRSRYGGTYEPGEWIAFPCLPSDIPDDWRGGDVACAVFFEQRRGEVGGGPTPDAALADLARLRAGQTR
ncbi:hypothetical protein [Streptacidiphilus neutrinimicus]|uniref:hypothetical protein n=1 Tax=Streptacidiphilus neutrinimicus TaxID=105420 RepID=UPI0012699336|nr:hypothetical protein [Streptacidiphilus neutrinimicus]